MTYLTPAWEKIKAENEAKEAEEKRLAEEEEKKWMDKLKKEGEVAAKIKAEEPKASTEIPQGPERQIARSGEHFLTLFSSLEGDVPLLYVVKKTGNRERVPFPVLSGNSFGALQLAFNLFENRVRVIGSTKPADIK